VGLKFFSYLVDASKPDIETYSFSNANADGQIQRYWKFR